LCNALALETLPIFLDRIVPSTYAILISVTAVLLVGEVIPQAICIGPQQLYIAECTAPLVTFLCYITSPISWPIAKSLDAMLGEHKLTRFTNDQLKGLVKMHCVEYMKECADKGAHFDIQEDGKALT
jgi:metal transporter CNNM